MATLVDGGSIVASFGYITATDNSSGSENKS